jgi:quinol monooxygenase YgiN
LEYRQHPEGQDEQSLNMKYQLIKTFIFTIPLLLIHACTNPDQKAVEINYGDMMIRIAEIEVAAEYLEAYTAILKAEAEASVRLEPGVICIYPMFQKEQPTEIRLLEIYANKAAYESHLKTPHFLNYKTTTLPMVKALRLVDMEVIDPETMQQLFVKVD